MFTNGRALNGEMLEADLCIVGAGAAGIAMAWALLDAGMRVIIIESGGFEPQKATLDLQRGETTGFRYSLDSSRLRWFGGSTNHWEGMCAPLGAVDFERREWIAHSGWPIARSDLDRHYVKASAFLNMSGDDSHDFSAPQDVMGHPGTLTFASWRFAKNLSLGDVYRDALTKSDTVNVVLNSNVVDMQLDAGMDNVGEVEVATLSGQRFKVRAKRYVLACGGIENARLLLACNKQMQQGIGNAYDNVGRFFMEHPHNEVGTFYTFGASDMEQRLRLHFGKPRGLRRVNPTIVTDKAAQTMNVTLSPAAMKKHKVGGGSLVIDTISDHRKADATLDYLRRAYGESGPVRALKLYARTEQMPNPDSRVMLSAAKRDALGMPRVRLHWAPSGQDRRTIHVLARSFAEAASAGGYGVARLAGWVASPPDRWPRHLRWGGHHMGTTRMHTDPQFGVVDADCKVHGMGNLYIAGSSVFTTSGWANPTYTLIALAFRLAEKLKQGV